MKKKLLSVVLTIGLIISMFPGIVFAGETQQPVKAASNVPQAQNSKLSLGKSEKTAIAPPSVTLRRAGLRNINVSWSKVSGADGYYIYQKNSQNKRYVQIKTISNGSILNYTDRGLKIGRTYYYKVVGFQNVDGKIHKSNYSAEKKLKL